MARLAAKNGAARALSFKVAGESYLIPSEGVLEVVRYSRLTRVPQGPDLLAGLLNYHGTAIPVVHMTRLLNVADGGADETRIIIHAAETPVGLLVDNVQRLSGASGTRQAAKTLDIGKLLAERFEVLAQPAGAAIGRRQAEAPGEVGTAEAVQALLVFMVGAQRFALPLESVDEVSVLPPDIAIVPRSDATVLGVFALRDSVVPLISVAGLMGLQADASQRPHVIVADLEGASVGFVVGAIAGVARVAESAIDPVPAILQRGEGDAEIEAIARVADGSGLVSILSPRKLLGNRHITDAIGQADKGITDMTAVSTPAAEIEQLLVIELGPDSYGLPIASVDEILHLPEKITRVPKAPDFLAGIISRRGTALPVIDQRRRFGATSSAGARSRARVVVLTIGELQAGFIVDAASEILRVARSAISRAPRLPGDGARIFDRVTTAGDDGRMILLIDPQELLDRAERELLERFSAQHVATPA